MKKILFVVSFVMLVFASTVIGFAKSPVIVEKPELKVIVNGKQQTLSNTPINYNGRILLGLRELLVALGVPDDDACIKWDPSDRSIRIFYYDKEVSLSIGNKNALVNGISVQIDAEPVIYKNRTYIPARFIAQSLEKLVFWDGETGSVVMCEESGVEELAQIFTNPKYTDRILRISNTEYLKVDGSETFRSSNNSVSDPKKNISYTKSNTVIDGNSEETEYYEDGKYIYSKPDYKDKWLKEPIEDSDDIYETEESFGAFIGSFVIKEKSDHHIVIEGDNFSLVANKKGTFLDATKDKTSRCHVVMEYDVYTEGESKKYFLKRREIKLKGRTESVSGTVPYENVLVYDYSIDEAASVTAPADLKNSYTMPKGFKEYYGLGTGLSFITPESWILPSIHAEAPFMYYVDEKNPEKVCGISVETIYDFDTSINIDDFRKLVGENIKNSYNNGKILKSENIKWKNYKAARMVFSGKDKETGESIKMQVMIVYYKGFLLMFTYVGEPTIFDSKLKEAETIINSMVDFSVG